MPSKLERLDAKVEEHRKARDKAEAQRDLAIKVLTRSADRIKRSTSAIVRIEKQRSELRRAERAIRKAPKVREGDEIPAL